MEVDISGFAGCECATIFIAFDGRIAVINCHVIRSRIVTEISFFANQTHEAIAGIFNVFSIAAPAGILIDGNLKKIVNKINSKLDLQENINSEY